MKFSKLKTDPRKHQYGRLVSAVLATLQEAVAYRVTNGTRQASLAKKIGMDPSYLSRVLNGNVPNLTVKTISDILWAAEHEPVEFSASPYEVLSPNYVPESSEKIEPVIKRIYEDKFETSTRAMPFGVRPFDMIKTNSNAIFPN